LPPIVERPDIPVRTRRSWGTWWAIWVIRPFWLWRREYGAAALLGGLAVPGWLIAGWVGAVVVPVGVVVSVVAVPEGSAWVVRVWRRARLRRHWDRACRFAGLASSNDRVPRIIAESHVPAGERLVVRMPRGQIPADMQDAAAVRVAAGLRVREVRVSPDAERADLAHVQIIRRDPFLDPADPDRPAVLPWPLVDAPQGRLWEPIPVGLDESGQTVFLLLTGKNMIVGGEPESGKSAAVSVLLAAAALDPWCRVWGLDAKRLELSLWGPMIERVVYNSIDDAITMFEDLVELMDTRYEALEREGVRKIVPGSELLLVIVDELRFYSANGDKKKRARWNDLAIDVLARGRACGIIMILATQKPSADVVPTSLRDLAAFRAAGRCATRDASDTILGAGMASLGHNAASIDSRTRGVMLLLAEGSVEPQRMKWFYLEDDEVRMIAARGAALRREYGTAT
jgi:hypothetical protein